MLGKIKRKKLLDQPSQVQIAQQPVCPICGRLIPASQRDAHHLVPKSRGGRATEFLHRVCHRQIHGLLSESELAREYNTAEALREHPDMQRFIDWVRSKPNDFLPRVVRSTRLRR